MTVHTANTQIVFNMVEQRWRGEVEEWRAMEGEELGKRQRAFIWIWNQLERRGAISSSVLRELFIRMTFTVRGGGDREGEREGEEERWKGVSGEMDKWHEGEIDE